MSRPFDKLRTQVEDIFRRYMRRDSEAQYPAGSRRRDQEIERAIDRLGLEWHSVNVSMGDLGTIADPEQGALIVGNLAGDAWELLGIGVAGHFLQMNGAGSMPEWAAFSVSAFGSQAESKVLAAPLPGVGGGPVSFRLLVEGDISSAWTDITTGNVSTTKHGLVPKLPNDATRYLDGTGAYSVPPLTQDAELTAIAGLTSAADKMIYFTGSGTAATWDLTSFARTLLNDADAPTARTTLGLGTIATTAIIAAHADSSGATTVADLETFINALLAKMRTSGALAT